MRSHLRVQFEERVGPDGCPPDCEIAEAYEEERDNEGHTEEELPGMDEILVGGRKVVTLAQERVVSELSVPLGEGGEDQKDGVEPDSQDGDQVTLGSVQISGQLWAAQTEAPGNRQAGALTGEQRRSLTC